MFVVTPIITYRKMNKLRESEGVLILLSIIAVLNSVVWMFIGFIFGIEVPLYPVDLIVAMVAFASYWFQHYFRVFDAGRKLAEKLRQADKQKDDFLANTSHEMRNPLHGIINISQSVLEREKDSIGDKSSEDLETLIAVGRRMSFMLNDLL